MPYKLGFPCGSAGKESTCNVGDLGLIPGLGRSPGEEKGYTLQYSGLENSMDCIVHGVTKSRTRLSDFHFTSPYNKKQRYSLKEICSLGDKQHLPAKIPFPDTTCAHLFELMATSLTLHEKTRCLLGQPQKGCSK